MAVAACGVGALALDAKSPEVTRPSGGLNLLQSLQVFTKFLVQTIGQDLVIFSILHVLSSV